MSLDRILFYLNIGLWCLMCLTYWSIGDNDYINFGSIVINSGLIITNLVILSYLKKNYNPLLVILSFLISVFYILRIITLNYTEFSWVFARWDLSHAEMNSAFLYILVAVILLALGLAAGKSTIRLANKSNTNQNIDTRRVKWLLVFVIIASFSSHAIPVLGAIFSLLTQLFLNIQLITLLCFVYIAFAYKDLTKSDKFHFQVILAVYILLFTFGGSRSAIVYVSIMAMIALLATMPVIRIKVKWMATFLVVVVPIACAFFLFATFIRQTDSRDVSYVEKIRLMSELKDEVDSKAGGGDESMALILSPIFDRVGFYDFATEIIAKKELYSETIDVCQLGKSMVDNVFSPFFNVFDAPRLANSFLFVYRNQGTPSLEKLEREEVSYQSDQLTMFGEFFLLFGGWLSLVLYLPLGFCLKAMYARLCSSSSVFSYFKAALLLYLFYTWLNSFGLDWLTFDVISAIISYLFFVTVVRIKENEKTTANIA